jgi:hypothetical protein
MEVCFHGRNQDRDRDAWATQYLAGSAERG